MKKLILAILTLFFSATMFGQTAGTLTVTYSTKTISNQTEYADAIYITDSSGALVNTLVYQTTNSNSSASGYLTAWWNLIGKTTPTATNTKFVGATDGISGASVKSSGWVTAKNVYWGRTTSVASALDGTYTVNFIIVEVTSGGSSVQGNIKYSGTFIKGTTASNSTVTATTAFYNLSLAWAPVNTAINDVEMDKYYSLYPSPAVSSIYVSGLDIEGIDICSVSGKILMHSNVQNVSISALPKGVYLAVVYTKAGTVVKKFQKI